MFPVVIKDTKHHANQTATVQLHRQYRILEHSRLGWVAEPVLNTEVNKCERLVNSEKEIHTEKTPRSLGKIKIKLLVPQKFDGGNYLNWLVQVTFNLKL